MHRLGVNSPRPRVSKHLSEFIHFKYINNTVASKIKTHTYFSFGFIQEEEEKKWFKKKTTVLTTKLMSNKMHSKSTKSSNQPLNT